MNVSYDFRGGTTYNQNIQDALSIQGVGIDMEEVARFRARDPVAEKFFYHTIFTQKEMRYCMSKKDPYPHFTARFCAKEAVIKALNGIRISFKNIEIINDKKGRPRVSIKEKNNNYTIEISLSHTKQHAIAIALWLH